MEDLFLIVGLGNPGPEYAATRHNAGFLLLEKLGALWNVAWRDERKFKARLAQADRSGRRVLLCQPQTFMNASGEAVGQVAAFYKVPAERLLVVTDDADLPLGEIRLRPRGGTGGHHGLESVQQHLGTGEFARQRIGIAPGARENGRREITDHVLGRFTAGERALFERVLERAAAQAQCWLDDGAAKAMNDFNGMVVIPEDEGT